MTRPILYAALAAASVLAPARADAQGLGSQSSEQLHSDLEQIDGLLASIDGGGTYILDPHMGLDPDPQAGGSPLVLPVATDDLEKTLLAMLLESDSDVSYEDYLAEVEQRTQTVRAELLAWRGRYDAELARRGEAAPDRGAPGDEDYADTRPPCGHTSEFGNTKEIRPGVYVECIPDDELSENPNATFRPRDHYEPPPVDWALPSLTLDERCKLTALAVMKNDAATQRALEGQAQLETQLKEIEEQLAPANRRAALDPTTANIQTAIKAAGYTGQVPEKHRSLADAERVADLERYVQQGEVLCRERGALDAVSVGAEMMGRSEPRELDWMCPILQSFPLDQLRGIVARARERDPFLNRRDQLRKQLEEKIRDLKELAARAAAEGRTADVLGCED